MLQNLPGPFAAMAAAKKRLTLWTDLLSGRISGALVQAVCTVMLPGGETVGRVMRDLFEGRDPGDGALRDAFDRMLAAEASVWASSFLPGFGCLPGMGEPHVKERPEPPTVAVLIHEMVSLAIDSGDRRQVLALHSILSRIDYRQGHAYEDEVMRLADCMDRTGGCADAPDGAVIRIEQTYLPGSCTFQAGSTQNGDVKIRRKKGKAKRQGK